MTFSSAICKRRVKVYSTSWILFHQQKTRYLSYTGYHDVSIRFPLVTSTVQGGEAHLHAGVVYSRDERNFHWRKIFYNYMQQLEHTNMNIQLEKMVQTKW